MFNTYFKRWDYVFYIDCGMTIFSDIAPMLAAAEEGTFLAHSDAYYTRVWRLRGQFCDHNGEEFAKLNSKYNLDIDYPQTTIMLYDTKLITPETFTDLLNLTMEHPISKTNEQGIVALYFTNVKPHYKQIRTHNEDTCFYDYSRDRHKKYIMTKML